MLIFILTAAALVAAFAIYLFLLAPRGGARRRFAPFLAQVYAHRGEYDNVRIPENSMAAFRRAVKRGVGIELDVHLTADGEVIVFHDGTLTRMCGDDRRVEDMRASEITAMTLLGTGERIPTLKEVLALVGGRVPLIVELKGETGNTALADAAMPILENYGGAYCVESFNPLLVARYRKLAPHVMRGVLTTKFRRDGEKRGLLGYALQFMLLNFLARPDFVAARHVYGGSLPVRLCRKLGAATFAWTVKTKEEYSACRRYFDAFICENLGDLLKK
ncbi:MAG: glycerophosphodiester phosphodiesterase [Clostridia bacterium]|nr:glycerophosphodiester phosphodiesterase [Clostridia bacterium]